MMMIDVEYETTPNYSLPEATDMFNHSNEETMTPATEQNFNEGFGDIVLGGAEIPSAPRVVADLASAVAIALNVGTLLAIYHTPGRLSVNLRLILSLSLSDMLVALCELISNRGPGLRPLVFAVDTCLYIALRGLQNATNIIALASLLGLAVDHYFAICRPLEYPRRMRPRLITAIIVTFWITATLVGFSDMLLPIGNCTCQLATSTYCEVVWCTEYESDYAVFPLALVVFGSMTVVYGLIYKQVHRYQRSRDLRNSVGRRLVRRNIRGLYTTLIIVCTFMTCWIPYCLLTLTTLIVLRVDSDTLFAFDIFRVYKAVDVYLYDLLLVNSIADPFIYAARMREVQSGYRHLVARMLHRRSVLRPNSLSLAQRSMEYAADSGRRRSSSFFSKSSGGATAAKVGTTAAERGSVLLCTPANDLEPRGQSDGNLTPPRPTVETRDGIAMMRLSRI